MKIKRIIALILITAIVYTGIASLVAWLIIRSERKDTRASNYSTESVFTDSGDMEIIDDEGAAIRIMSKKLTKKQYAAYSISNEALEAYTLTATVNPAKITNFVELDWTAEWYRADMTWVEGEDVYDYIKVTPSGDLGHQATIECLKGWDEPVIVKASLKDTPGIYASCWCAYIVRYGKATATLEDGTFIPFEKDETPHFTLETTSMGKGKLTFTGLTDRKGTSDTSVFDLSMTIHDVLAEKLRDAGFNVNSKTVVYGNPLYSPQLQLSKYGYDTMLYLPGADAAIVGTEQSNLIKQGYLWATSGTDEDSSLSQQERDAYNRYREAVLAAWEESDEFLITLTLTQYDSKENRIVLRTYNTQMDFVANEIIPELPTQNLC